jgi:hypothetical protein
VKRKSAVRQTKRLFPEAVPKLPAGHPIDLASELPRWSSNSRALLRPRSTACSGGTVDRAYFTIVLAMTQEVAYSPASPPSLLRDADVIARAPIGVSRTRLWPALGSRCRGGGLIKGYPAITTFFLTQRCLSGRDLFGCGCILSVQLGFRRTLGNLYGTPARTSLKASLRVLG